MHAAVDSMVGEYRKAFFAFLKGILALHGTAICYSIIMLQTWWEKSIICICVLVSLYMVLHYIRVLLKKFAIPVHGAMTGKFERAEDLTSGVASGVRDASEIATLSTLIHTQEALDPGSSSA